MYSLSVVLLLSWTSSVCTACLLLMVVLLRSPAMSMGFTILGEIFACVTVF